MSPQCFLLRIAILLLALGLVAGTAQATHQFSLVGGGGQIHIGNGLALPIQQAATVLQTGTVFPPLGIGVRAGDAPVITGTVDKPLIVVGEKRGWQRMLAASIPLANATTTSLPAAPSM